jgi:hypothetical protein
MKRPLHRGHADEEPLDGGIADRGGIRPVSKTYQMSCKPQMTIVSLPSAHHHRLATELLQRVRLPTQRPSGSDPEFRK